MTGGDVLIACLRAQGARAVFGMPGNQNIHIYDALLRDGTIPHYLIRNEQGATLIANGFARASGEVGVAFTVPGPGASNASTGLVDAHTDHVPVLLVTGGTETVHDGRDRSKCFHGLDQRAFFAPVVGAFERPASVDRIPAAVVRAFRALRAPRPTPAVIELPADVAAATAAGPVDIPPRVEGDLLSPSAVDIDKAARTIAGFRRPIILAGGNIIAAAATRELLALAEKIRAPVTLTRLGKGAFPDGHPLCLGHCRGRLSREVLSRADGLVAVGTRFTQIDTSGWTMAMPERRVQLDPDPGEIGREFPVDVGLAGDLGRSLPAVSSALRPAAEASWLSEVQSLRRSVCGGRPPVPILSAIRARMPDDAIFCVDVTSFGYRAFDELPIKEPRTFLYPCHSVTLGFAFPAAIGAALARPDRQVVAFCGDGGYQMNLCELATAVEHDVRLTVVVINDGSLSAIRGAQAKAFDGRTIGTDFRVPHLSDAAKAFGARGLRVDDPDRFPAVFADVVGLPGPTVIEVMMADRRDAIIRQVPWLYPDN